MKEKLNDMLNTKSSRIRLAEGFALMRNVAPVSDDDFDKMIAAYEKVILDNITEDVFNIFVKAFEIENSMQDGDLNAILESKKLMTSKHLPDVIAIGMKGYIDADLTGVNTKKPELVEIAQEDFEKAMKKIDDFMKDVPESDLQNFEDLYTEKEEKYRKGF